MPLEILDDHVRALLSGSVVATTALDVLDIADLQTAVELGAAGLGPEAKLAVMEVLGEPVADPAELLARVGQAAASWVDEARPPDAPLLAGEHDPGIGNNRTFDEIQVELGEEAFAFGSDLLDADAHSSSPDEASEPLTESTEDLTDEDLWSDGLTFDDPAADLGPPGFEIGDLDPADRLDTDDHEIGGQVDDPFG